MRGLSRIAGVCVPLVLLMAVMVQPAHAVHLFPLTPGFDPRGHDCAKNLQAAPETTGAEVSVVGFSFIDPASNSSTTTVASGDSVTWTWLADHCHSVTFSSPGEPNVGTYGSDGFQPAGQPQLVRLNGADGSFTMSFPEPGTYSYLCVHHAAVGMQGSVVVQ